MSEIVKKLSDSYIHGLAKAMDMQNSIKCIKSVPSTTISSVWNNVGNEIFSAMQNQSLLKTLNTINNKLLHTQISKILDTNKTIKIQKTKSMASAMAKINKMINDTGVANYKPTMIAERESLESKMAKINKMINDTGVANYKPTMIAERESLESKMAKIHKMINDTGVANYKPTMIAERESLVSKMAKIHKMSNDIGLANYKPAMISKIESIANKISKRIK